MVSVAITPNPFATATSFSQVFDVATATVTFTTPALEVSVLVPSGADVRDQDSVVAALQLLILYIDIELVSKTVYHIM